MRMRVFFSVLFLGFVGWVFFVSGTKGAPKCTGDEEYALGLGVLGDFKLLKDYRIVLKGGTPPPAESFMVSLKAGLKYHFIPINNPDNKKKMIMSVYLNEQKGMMLGTTFNKATGKHYPSIDFVSRTTGTFYLFFEMEGGEKGCGVGMFSVAN